MLTLFSQYYVPIDPHRKSEIDECFKQNLANPLVGQLIVFFEKIEDQAGFLNHPKVVKKILPRRLMYRDWLEQTNQLNRGSLAVLVNSDIYLTESIQHLINNSGLIAKQKRFIALSRYNPSSGKYVLNSNPHWTQDTWALVRSEEDIPNNLLQEASFELGHPGCDNKIAYVMQSYGYILTNPCKTVVTVHLQADERRSYNPKSSKLLGLHAFVHPTNSVGEDAAVEYDLLTRSKSELRKIKVNHWINDRPSYYLEANLENKNPNPLDTSNVQDVAVARLDKLEPSFVPLDLNKLSYKDDPQIKRLHEERNLIQKNQFSPSSYIETAIFSERFKIFSDHDSYYIYDDFWPYVKKVKKTAWAHHEISSDNPLLFIDAFAPSNLCLENITIGNQIKYPEDILFWQYPCRTEGSAAQRHIQLESPTLMGQEVSVYLPIPWATFIDKKKFPVAYLGLMARRISGIKAYLLSKDMDLRVHTVCQHIHFKRDLPRYLNDLGVTDLWTSHKLISDNYINQTRLHAWPLYAVNFRQKDRSDGLVVKSVESKKYLASFVGAYMDHYISDIRLKLRELGSSPNFYIQINDEWHFNKVVYDVQVGGKHHSEIEKKDHEVIHYNQILSDSVFSLCPSGAGPNSLRLWESLAIGSIPVILSDQYELPSLDGQDGLNQNSWKDAVICYPENEIDNLEQFLRQIPLERCEEMQKNCMKIYKAIESMTCF